MRATRLFGNFSQYTARQAVTRGKSLFSTSAINTQAKPLNNDNSVVAVNFGDGTSARFHNYWLRDHCRCEKCIHPTTKQRTVDPLTFSETIAPTKQTIVDQKLVLEWDGGKHVSEYQLSWLKRNSYDKAEPKAQKIFPSSEVKRWGSEMTGKIPTVDYEKVMNTDEGLYEWLNNIRIYGLGTVSGVPVTEEATKKTIERIGPIRDTHYGAFWAFTSGFAHGDLAYSTLEIPAHTDTTYFNDPAGLQLFHLLEEAGVGGEQFYVDGFAAAEILKKEDPEAHKILSEARVYGYQAGDENVFLKPTAQPYPLLNYNNKGELYQIRFNNEDRYIINNLKFDMVPKYYNALRKWMEIVRRPESELVLALKPGTLIAIDNWRVMHARKSFKGGRTLSGGYVDTDYWKSKYRVVSFRAKGKDCKAELL